jgi:hypothetical protein
MATATRAYPLPAGGGGGGAVSATVLSRTAGNGTFTIDGGVIDGGLLEGGTTLNDALMLSLVGDGAEEVMKTDEPASGAGRPGEDTANSLETKCFHVGWEVVGDFEIKLRAQYDIENANGFIAVSAWSYPTSGQDNRVLVSCLNGWQNNHKTYINHEGSAPTVDTDGAAITETDFNWVRLKREGDKITTGFSTDDVTYSDTTDEGQVDMIGSQCWVGVMAGGNTFQPVGGSVWNLTDFYLSYFPAT